MNSTNLQVMPAPPSLMKSLTAGFDAISNHIGLILFSVSLDLLLWFSPRIRLTNLLKSVGEQSAIATGNTSPGMLEWIGEATERLNLLGVLRTFPVGVPSLMASRSPIVNPLGEPLSFEVPSLEVALGLWLLFVLIGIVVGTLYFASVAQAALSGKVVWRQALRQWPWTSLQVFFLSLFWFALLFSTIFPLLCILSFFLTGGLGLEQFLFLGLVSFGLLALWLLLPLAFSPHGIFVKLDRMWVSLLKGARLTRVALRPTILLLLTFLVLSEGLRLLWNVPSDASWWMLVGIAGHSFITTSLLASSFIFYRDAELWIQNMLKHTDFPVT